MKLTQNKLNDLISRHKNWVESGFGIRPNFENLDLSGLDLRGANLSHSYFTGSNLSHCNLRLVNFYRADLRNTNFYRSSIEEANLFRANLNGANLDSVKYNENTMFFSSICPEEGSIIGYKKVKDGIVKLFIPEDAKRCSATTYKCRCDKAIVLDILDLEGNKIEKANSIRDRSFEYIVGKELRILNYEDNRWLEAAAGIHFFLTKDLAKIY